MADDLLAAIVNGAKLGEKVAEGHHLIAMGARSPGSKPTTENAALVTALLAKEARIALRALVHDGRVWQTVGKTQGEFVGWSLTEAEATLAAGVRAVGLATLSGEVVPASAADALLVGSRAIVTQRSFPQVGAVVGASKPR